jgi:hypothetical protein
LFDAGIDAGFIESTGLLGSQQSAPIEIKFDPQRPGADIAFVVITTDNGPISCELIGVGIDECANINLDGGCDAGYGQCAGTCTNGACQWPSSTACVDGTKCVTNGTCNGAGACEGPSSCIPTGYCDGGGAVFDLQMATNLDAGTGYCEGSTSPLIPGSCLYSPPIAKVCDCGCGTLPSGNPGCLYNWAPDPGSPTDAFGSVWASNAGDAWATTSTSAPQGNTIPQAFYERVNGTWVQQATLPLGSNPLAGSGGTVALTGDQLGDIYGASACSFPDTFFMNAQNMPTEDCGDAGIWKWSEGTAVVEPFVPPSITNGCGGVFDFAQTYPVLLGSSAAVLNSDPCGPEIMTESNGQFDILGGSQLPLHCSAVGALWGTSTTDVYIAWACGGSSNAGGIWHFAGQQVTTTPDFPFTEGNNDYAAAIAGTSDSDIWAVGTQRWHYNGVSWTVMSTMPPDPDSSLWSVGDGTYFAAGTYPGVYHYTNSSWQLECLAPGYSGEDPSVAQVAGDGQNNFYAATQLGIFKRQ